MDWRLSPSFYHFQSGALCVSWHIVMYTILLQAAWALDNKMSRFWWYFSRCESYVEKQSGLLFWDTIYVPVWVHGSISCLQMMQHLGSSSLCLMCCSDRWSSTGNREEAEVDIVWWSDNSQSGADYKECWHGLQWYGARLQVTLTCYIIQNWSNHSLQWLMSPSFCSLSPGWMS